MFDLSNSFVSSYATHAVLQRSMASVASTALASALADDPFYDFISAPLPEAQRRRALELYMAAAVAEGRAVGRVQEECEGAAVWSLPGNTAAQEAAAAEKCAVLSGALGETGLARYKAVVESMTSLAAPFELAEAWYLSILGVSPASWRKGVARRLLSPTLQEADAAGVACWLETYYEETLQFYSRFGFMPLQPLFEPVCGARYWVMVRPARAKTAKTRAQGKGTAPPSRFYLNALLACALTVLLLLCLSGPVGAPPRSAAELVAVADLHGDLPNALRSLQLGGVADGSGHWVGGTSHLVQTGDLVDRGPSSLPVLQLLWRLRDEAQAAGGRVTLLLGNHEVWALSGDNTYASREELTALGRGSLRAGRSVWNARFNRHSGDVGQRIAGTHAAAVVAGEGTCRSLFVHAGLLPSFTGGVKGDAVIERLNQRLADAMKSRGELSAADRALFGENGPFWLRSLALGAETRACASVRETLTAVNATRMVVGHTVQEGGARARCGGALVLLDAGASDAYYGRPTAFECRQDTGAAVLQSRGKRALQTPAPSKR